MLMEAGSGLGNRPTHVGPLIVTEIRVINPKGRFIGLLNEGLSVRWLRIRLKLAREFGWSVLSAIVNFGSP